MKLFRNRGYLVSFVPHPRPLPARLRYDSPRQAGEGDGFLPLPGGEGWGEGTIPCGGDSDRTFETHSRARRMTRDPAPFRLIPRARGVVAIAVMLVPLLAGAAISPEEEKLWGDAQGATPRAVIRREARAMLEKSPESFVAAYVLGRLESDDGQFPDAIRELKRARHLSDLGTASSPEEQTELAQWRARIALSLADAFDNADRLPEALRAWDDAESLHTEVGGMPDRTLRRIDALLKLGHIDAAQNVLDVRLKAPDLKDSERMALRVAGARILFAREPDGARAYEAFEAIARDARGVSSFIFPFGDLAFHARRQGHTDRALAALAEGAGIQHATSAAHPFRGMAEIHLAAGNWAAAKSDIRNAWNALQTKRADIRHELLADTHLCAAYFYLAAGYPERAERLARPYVALPIRSGFSSRPLEQWQAGVNLLCWSASRHIRTLERASAHERPWPERIRLFGHHAVRRWNEMILARRIRGLVISQAHRNRPIRDAFAVVDAPLWLWGDLAAVLGPRRFNELFVDYPLRGAPQRYYASAMEIESAFAAHDWKTVADRGPAALEEVPPDEALLRGRLGLMIGESERRLGREQASLVWFRRSYEGDRSAPVRTGIKLPAAQVPPELTGSPLLETMPSGPRIAVERTDNRCSLRLIWAQDSEIRFPPLEASPDTKPALVAHRLHRLLFSPVGLLSESDYAALEGNAVSGRPE